MTDTQIFKSFFTHTLFRYQYSVPILLSSFLRYSKIQGFEEQSKSSHHNEAEELKIGIIPDTVLEYGIRKNFPEFFRMPYSGTQSQHKVRKYTTIKPDLKPDDPLAHLEF